MTRFVIGPDVALRLAREKAVVPSEHELLAPTLMRSQLQADALVAVAPYTALVDDARGT